MLRHSLGEQIGLVGSFPNAAQGKSTRPMPSRVQCYPPIEDRSLQLTSEIDMNGLNQPNWTVRIWRLTIFWMDSFQKMLSNLLKLEAIPVSGQSPIAREGFESPLSAIGSQLGSCSPVEGLKPIPERSRWFFRGSTAFPMLSPWKDWSPGAPNSDSTGHWLTLKTYDWLTFHCHVSPPVMLLQTGAARVFGSTLAHWGNFGAGGSWKENTGHRIPPFETQSITVNHRTKVYSRGSMENRPTLQIPEIEAAQGLVRPWQLWP